MTPEPTEEPKVFKTKPVELNEIGNITEKDGIITIKRVSIRPNFLAKDNI